MSGNQEDTKQNGGGFKNALKAFTRRINPFSKKKNSTIYVKKPNGKWYRSVYKRGVTVEKNTPVTNPPQDENLRSNEFKINKSGASFKKQLSQAFTQTRKAGNTGRYYTVRNGKRTIRTYSPQNTFEEEILNMEDVIPANVSPLEFSNFRRRKYVETKHQLLKLKERLIKYRRDMYYSLKAFVNAFTMNDLNSCIGIITDIVNKSIFLVHVITKEHNYVKAIIGIIDVLIRVFGDLLNIVMHIFKRYKTNRLVLIGVREELRTLRIKTEGLIKRGTAEEVAAASALLPAIITAEQTHEAVEALFNRITKTEHVENLQNVVQSLKNNPPPGIKKN